MIGDVELSHDFGKGIGDAGRELEQGKPLEMASLCSFLRLSGFFAVSVLCQPGWFSVPSPPRSPWYLLAGFQHTWPCLEVVRVNMQCRHLGDRDEICAQKEKNKKNKQTFFFFHSVSEAFGIVQIWWRNRAAGQWLLPSA